MFPLTQLQDLIAMVRTKKFLRKRGLKDILAIADFAVDQLADDEAPVDPGTLPVAARAATDHHAALADVLPDLEALEAQHANHAAKHGKATAHGLFSGFDFKGLLGKLLPLILSLLGGMGAAPGAAPAPGASPGAHPASAK